MKALTAVLPTLALVLTLSACSAETTAAPTSSEPTASTTEGTTPTATETSTPTPEPTPTQFIPTIGQTITQDQVKAVKEMGYAAYKMGDGTYVAVDPNQDLPQAVKDDLLVRANGAGADGSVQHLDAQASKASTSGTMAVIYAAMDANKKVVGVGYGVNRDANGDAIGSPFYGVSVLGDPSAIRPGSSEYSGIGSHDVAVAKAQAWIAAQANPQAYVLIDFSQG